MSTFLLRNKAYFISMNFFFLLITNFISSLGDYIYQVGIIVYLYTETDSAAVIGGYFIIQFTSSLILSPIIGTFIDRLDKKNILLYTNIIRAVAVGVLLLHISTFTIYFVAIILGINEEAFGATQNSIIPEIVSKNQTMKANSLISAFDSVNMIIGPALAGILISIFGINGSIIINIVSFLFAAILALFIKLKQNNLMKDTVLKKNFWNELKDGLFIIIKNSLVKEVILIWGLLLIGIGATGSLLIFLLSDYMKLPSDSYGWAMTAEGMGIVFGSLIILKYKDKFTFQKLIKSGLIIIGVSLTAIAITSNLIVVLIAYCFTGLSAAAAPLGLRSTLQTRLPKEILGRVFMSVRFIVTSLRVFSVIAATILISYVNLRVIYVIAALVILLAGMVSFIVKLDKREDPLLFGKIQNSKAN